MEATKGYRALLKNLPMSPSKIRPIANHIRRKSYIDAIAILDAFPQKGAGYLKKAIQSAAANAMYQDQNLDEESLFVTELLVDGGPSRTTIWPRSHGRADRQIKRSSHIRVVLDHKVVE